MNREYHYSSFEDDFFDDGNEHILPKDYVYIKNSFLSRAVSCLVYALAVAFGTVYCRLFLHLKIVGRDNLRKHKGSFVLYGNHTQPLGDVFIPALVCFPRRIYTVASAANLDLPVIGKILRPLGALPLPSTVDGMKNFGKAIKARSNNHPIVIYPEAHVWPYYTEIRPFSEASFKYPEKLGLPMFTMTTTYQKKRLGRKPKTVVYIDGPVYGKGNSAKEKAQYLHDAAYNSMVKRSRQSDAEYVRYVEDKTLIL